MAKSTREAELFAGKTQGKDPSKDPVAYLRRVAHLPDEAIDLAQAALALSALDHPDILLEPYLRHLDALAQALREAGARANTPADRQAALVEVMVRQFDYHGDPTRYDDPQNGDMVRVIDRRKGLPVALGILYLTAARAAGWASSGINFPGHFLIRLDAPGEGLVIDPFHDGRALDLTAMKSLLSRMTGSDELMPEHYQPMQNRDILLRLMNNLKNRALSDGAGERAAQLVERMLLIAPGYHFLHRELGVARAEQGKMRAALEAFREWSERTDVEGERQEAQAMIERLMRRLN